MAMKLKQGEEEEDKRQEKLVERLYSFLCPMPKPKAWQPVGTQTAC